MDEEVEAKVNGPGIALMVVGILSLIGSVGGLIWQGITAIPAMLTGMSEGVDFWLPFATGTGWSLCMSMVGFVTAFLIINAGVSMRSARSAGMVYAGSVVAIIPCCTVVGCCCFSVPIGIWAIVVMQDEKVKEAFAEVSY
jgi:hypothetical protein